MSENRVNSVIMSEKVRLVNTVTASFNTVMGQITEMSQEERKTAFVFLHAIDNRENHARTFNTCKIGSETIFQITRPPHRKMSLHQTNPSNVMGFSPATGWYRPAAGAALDDLPAAGRLPLRSTVWLNSCSCCSGERNFSVRQATNGFFRMLFTDGRSRGLRRKSCDTRSLNSYE